MPRMESTYVAPQSGSIKAITQTEEEFKASICAASPAAFEVIAQTQQAVKELEVKMLEQAKPPQPGDDIVLTPLGTGSSMPSMYRNGKHLLAFLSLYLPPPPFPLPLQLSGPSN